jgi:hypothetical protein
LIDAYDEGPVGPSKSNGSYSPFSTFQQQEVVSAFTEGKNNLDAVSAAMLESPAEAPTAGVNFENSHEMVSLDPNKIDYTWQLTLPIALRAETRLDPGYAYLFHHYCNYVAPMFTPVPSSYNPWLRYPAIALHRSFEGGQKHLLHALISLAAIHQGNIRDDSLGISTVGRNLYSKAMAELRSCLGNGSMAYIDLLMTMMIFLFIEVSNANEGAACCWCKSS